MSESRHKPELDAEAVAGEVIATLDGLRLQWLLDPAKVNLKRSLSAYAQRLSAELAPAPTKRRRAVSAP